MSFTDGANLPNKKEMLIRFSKTFNSKVLKIYSVIVRKII